MNLFNKIEHDFKVFIKHWSVNPEAAPPNHRDLLSVLPKELLEIIFKQLSLSSVANVVKTCRRFRTIANGVKGLKGRAFIITHLEKKESNLFIKLAHIVGFEIFKNYPVLNLNRQVWDYIDFLKAEDLTAEVMVGQDKWKRLFVALRYVDRLNNTILVETIFERYANDPSNFITVGGTCSSKNLENIDLSLPVDQDYLYRMVNHKPCGLRSQVTMNDREPKTIDGKSAVELV